MTLGSPSRKRLKDGEAGFLQGCQLVNDELAKSSSSTSLPKTLTTADKIAEVFGEKQLREIAFSNEKEKKARIEELLLGVVRREDITPEMVALAEEYAGKVAKIQRERNNDQKVIQNKVSQKAVPRMLY
jgi:predicted ArsR family transcriptional regulator